VNGCVDAQCLKFCWIEEQGGPPEENSLDMPRLQQLQRDAHRHSWHR
jgi:hypothetical protein